MIDERSLASSPSRHDAAPWLWPVLVLAICHLQAICSAQIVNILVDPIKASLAISDTQYSLLQGLAIAIFAALLGLPVARLADSGRRRNIIIAAVFVWSLGSIGSGLARNFTELFLARMVVGLGEVFLFPAAFSMIADVAPRARLASSIGLFGVGGPLGLALALIVGGWITAQGNLSLAGIEIEAWRMAFFWCGFLGLLTIIGLLTIREPRQEARHKAAPGSDGLMPYLRDHWQVFFGTSGGLVALSTAVFATVSWAPTFLVRAFGMSHEAAGAQLGLAAILGGIFGTWLIGVAIDRICRRGRPDGAVLCTIGVAIYLAIAISAAVTASTATIATMLLFAVYLFPGMPTVLGGTALQQIAPPHLRAQALALHVVLINIISQTVGATSVALLNDHVFHDPRTIGWAIGLVDILAAGLTILILISIRTKFIRLRGALEAVEGDGLSVPVPHDG